MIKDASPEDYNNEELYHVMEKIYYVVSGRHELMCVDELHVYTP